jgi:hypothetical protein
MMISRTTARNALIMLAITSSCVFFLAPAFGNSAPHSLADDVARSAEPSTPLIENDSDLRLVADTVASLRRIHTDSMDTDIPVAAKPLLTTLKHQLRDLIANRLRFEKRRVSTQQLQARAIVDLSNLGLIDNEEGYVVFDGNYFDRGYDYGHIESITVTRPHCDFDVIAVTTTVGICCGEDTSLYLFKLEDEEWKLWLADEKNDYDRIDNAQGLFEFGLSWPEENKTYFVVTASVNPWCTSNWQSITYRVLRPGAEPYAPRVLLSRKETIYLGNEDPPYRLEVGDSAFTLRFYGDKYSDLFSKGAEGNADDESIKELVRCRVEGDAVITEK